MSKIEEKVLRQLDEGSDDPLRVVIQMKNNDEAGIMKKIQDADNKREKIDISKLVHEASAGGVLAFLDEKINLSAANLATDWLSNSVIVNLPPGLVEKIAEREDVDRIYGNIFIKTPEPVKDSEGNAHRALDRRDVPEDDKSSTWGLKAIKALEAREKFGVTGDGVVVGILDTGIVRHEAFRNKELLAFGDFINGESVPYDDNGHGTHCAGTIGGRSINGMEIGVAPDAAAVVGKMLAGSGGGFLDQILAAMAWIVDPDGKPDSGDEPCIVSNSWGANGIFPHFHKSVLGWLRLGILPVFAAGNAGPEPRSVGTPGGYPESFAIGATTKFNEMAEFSSRGPAFWEGSQYTKPDVSAPGHHVTSAWPGRESRTISGTSMATPHVAGMAALLKEFEPRLTPKDLKSIIEESCSEVSDYPPGKNNTCGFGQVDCYEALSSLT